MPRAAMLMVFCYDVTDDRRRRRVAAVLEDSALRVQQSVFEARMSEAGARRLAERIGPELGIGDSLRIYAVDSDGLRRSMVFGGAPIQSERDYHLL